MEIPPVMPPITAITLATIAVIILGLAMLLSNLIITNSSRYKKYGSKKFLVSLLIVHFAAITTWLGKLDGGDSTWLFSLVGGGYTLSNVISLKNTYNPELTEDSSLLSRKFIVAVCIAVYTTLLTLHDHMDSVNLTTSLFVTGTMFGIGNVWGKSIHNITELVTKTEN